jgi:hypothetical protein
VRICAGTVKAPAERRAASNGESVAIVFQALSWNRLLTSLTGTAENLEGCFNVAYQFSADPFHHSV